MRAAIGLLLLVLVAACGDNDRVAPPEPTSTAGRGHSSSIAVSSDGAQVFVVNPDVDSVSIIDASARTLAAEIALGPRPAVDGAGAFTPSVLPRALAVSRDGATLYVTGMRAGALFAIDLGTHEVRSTPVGSEPVGVAVSGDGTQIFVANSQDANVVAVAADSFVVDATIAVPAEPWALGFADDGTLLVTHLLGPGVTAIDPEAASVISTYAIPDMPARPDDARLAHGQVRGIYDVVARPHSAELWAPHLLLGTDTAQPDLDFETTVFPAVSILRDDGTFRVSLSIDVADIPGTDGAIADIVSGPHALAFTSDGAYALVVDTNSEDILAIDANNEREAALLRPLPGHMPEGIAIAPDNSVAYIDQRNTGDVAVIALTRAPGEIALAVDGAPIPRFDSDPMPANMRFGQHLFYSANSDEFPITTNHWVACASCHIEGRSDAVTWKFEQGPRDTPTNAGGLLGTGFLFRTADRNQVQDYWRTINVEQGGTFDATIEAPLLDAIALYVNFGIPAPKPPTTDPALVAAGKAIFERTEVGCSTCHAGPRFTDSGAGNPQLDLAGLVMLHDVGTCNTTDFPDVAHSDILGDARDACRFDTPSLIGVAATPPYLHDGRAATLRDVLEITRGRMGDISSLSEDDLKALVEYVRSL
jgi:YVTN family beta-propeller protein